MGFTGHEAAVMRHVNKLLTRQDWAQVLAQYLEQMQSGKRRGLDVYVQKFGLEELDLYDAYCYSYLRVGVMLGRIVTARVEIGETPSGDQSKRNAEILAGLNGTFYGEFQGGLNDSDGYFGWKKPIRFGQVLLDGKGKHEIVKPRKVPLEVGYTKSSRTLCHILEEHALARWPYGDTGISLFVTSDRNVMSDEQVIRIFESGTQPSLFLGTGAG